MLSVMVNGMRAEREVSLRSRIRERDSDRCGMVLSDRRFDDFGVQGGTDRLGNTLLAGKFDAAKHARG